jgi:F1F0 ATPase subunit 2
MNETLTLLIASLIGGILGAVFFGGLWWTVRRGMTSENPAAWFFGSITVRALIVLAGFYFVGGGSWRRIAACLLGFTLARMLVAGLTRGDNATSQEANHATQS